MASIMINRSLDAFWLRLLVCGWIWGCVACESLDICPGLGENLHLACDPEEVIVMTSATFGRMEQGRCIHENVFIGCTNDVMYLADRWCSGRQLCDSVVPNSDLETANDRCESYLMKYMHVEYQCTRVLALPTTRCSGLTNLPDNSGIVSSHVTDETGCGSTRSPWVIAAMPGQTIEISIIDFGSENLKRNNVTSSPGIYGYIRDGSAEETITAGTQRERLVYSSHSSQIQIRILPVSDRGRDASFLLRYHKIGCPDLTPPAHAWYKRDGDQAVIGCEWSQKTWHLSCDGHSWSGVVGNCSESATEGPVKEEKKISSPSALWLVCVVSVSVVLMVVACVIGVVCIKKYRIKQDVQKSMTLQRPPGQGHYDLDPNIEMASMLYLPYKSCEQEQGTLSDPQRPTSYLVPQDQAVNELSPIRIWERPLPDLPDKPLASGTMCACPTTRRGRTPGDGDEAVGNSNVQEGGTLQSYQADVSTTPSQGGHNYSALGAPNV